MLCRLSYPGNAWHTRVERRNRPGVPEEISRSPSLRRISGARRAEPRHNGCVKIRIAAAAAVAVGFVLGVKRSRRTRLGVVTADGTTVRPKGRRSGVGWGAKAKAVGVLSIVRLRDALGVLGGWRDGEEATDALVIEMTGDLATAINEHSSLAV